MKKATTSSRRSGPGIIPDRDHEPLCARQEPPECLGCLLVELRSDATYEEDPEARAVALERLASIRDLVQAHLDDVLAT